MAFEGVAMLLGRCRCDLDSCNTAQVLGAVLLHQAHEFYPTCMFKLSLVVLEHIALPSKLLVIKVCNLLFL